MTTPQKSEKHVKLKISVSLLVVLVMALLVACGSDTAHKGANDTDKDSIGSKASEKYTYPGNEYLVSPNSDTTLFGSLGTRLFIEKGIFQFENGQAVDGKVKIDLIEVYNKSDMVLGGLLTVSDGKVLETAGMVHIEAFSNGKKLQIGKDKQIIVHFPRGKAQKGEPIKMDLFYANKASTNEVVSDWKIDTVSLVKKVFTLFGWGYVWPNATYNPNFYYRAKDYVDTGYYWNNLDLFLNKYKFSNATIHELDDTRKYAYILFTLDKNGKITKPSIDYKYSKISQEAGNEILQFVNTLPEFVPCKDKQGNNIELKGSMDIMGGVVVPIYRNHEEYMKSFDKKYARFEKSPIKNMNDAELEFYVFSVTKLGWINCDRFLNTKDTVNFIVETPYNADTQLKLIFKDINGVMKAENKDGKYCFFRVPKGKQATVFGIKHLQGKFFAAFAETTLADKPISELKFQETTLNELKEQLKKFN